MCENVGKCKKIQEIQKNVWKCQQIENKKPVGKCQKLSKNAGKCKKMSENV